MEMAILYIWYVTAYQQMNVFLYIFDISLVILPVTPFTNMVAPFKFRNG